MMMSNGTTHAEERYRESLTRLPQLADPAIHINLTEEIRKLRTSPGWEQPIGRSSATLVKHENLRIVLVLMKGGSRMSHHRTEDPISIHTLQGRIRLEIPQLEAYELGSGELLSLQGNLDHDVAAMEESAFLLTIGVPTSARS